MKTCLLILVSIGLVASQGMEGVEYLLWTRANPDTHQVLIYNDGDSLAASNFDGSKRTYFAYHGWQNDGFESFIIDAKTGILALEDANFISVNWGELAGNTIYLPSVSSMYEVAEQTSNFIVFISGETGLTPANIHVWGHSLGAHASGMTGHGYTALTGQLLSRVTGLDPAAPSFEEEPSNRRIDITSAVYVDIIHTNAGPVSDACIGLEAAVGHADFYPNGGAHQPGCIDFGIDLIDLISGCSHGRSHEFFVESIIGSVPFTAQPCDTWELYQSGACNCDAGCLEMGFFVDQSFTGTYYLETNGRSPFAQG